MMSILSAEIITSQNKDFHKEIKFLQEDLDKLYERYCDTLDAKPKSEIGRKYLNTYKPATRKFEAFIVELRRLVNRRI